MEALLSIITGGMGGALLRLIPEGIKLFQASADRKHELKILDLQMRQQAAGHQQRLEEIRVTSEAQQSVAQIQGAVSASKATGIWIVDVLNGLFRPTVSFWFFGLYAAYKTVGLWNGGFSWNEQDMATLTGILNFWFLGRVLDKRGK